MSETPKSYGGFAPSVTAFPATRLTNGRQNFDDADRSGAMWFVKAALHDASVTVTPASA
ncbi:hypothetical protein [Embleya sp. NPDC020630]|uniref:hypothetical protein n=1 Tax=Embleya sp. NPDC020630 TaxID=3363979 RepID=UPI0037875704